MHWPAFTAIFAAAGILGGLLDALTALIAQYGYPAVFAAAFLEVIFPPIPSEVIFPLVGFTAFKENLGMANAVGMAATGALGSTVGAILIYFISKKVGRAAIIRFGRHARVGEAEIVRAESWFRRYGSVAVFTGRMVPGIREIISIPAGIGGMNFPKFVLYTYTGSLAWSVALTLVGYYLGEAWETFSEQASDLFTYVGIAVVAAAGAAVMIMVVRRKRKASASEQ